MADILNNMTGILQNKKEPKLERTSSGDMVEYFLKQNGIEIGHIRGNFILMEVGSYINLEYFNVSKEHRGLGYGRKLMEAVVNELEDYNATHVNNPVSYIRVYPSSGAIPKPEGLYTIYERLGFYFISEHPDRSKTGEFMRRDL